MHTWFAHPHIHREIINSRERILDKEGHLDLGRNSLDVELDPVKNLFERNVDFSLTCIFIKINSSRFY